jgi:hypothetical protein
MVALAAPRSKVKSQPRQVLPALEQSQRELQLLTQVLDAPAITASSQADQHASHCDEQASPAVWVHRFAKLTLPT